MSWNNRPDELWVSLRETGDNIVVSCRSHSLKGSVFSYVHMIGLFSTGLYDKVGFWCVWWFRSLLWWGWWITMHILSLTVYTLRYQACSPHCSAGSYCHVKNWILKSGYTCWALLGRLDACWTFSFCKQGVFNTCNYDLGVRAKNKFPSLTKTCTLRIFASYEPKKKQQKWSTSGCFAW